MDFGALQAFLAIAESGSFSRAGERLFLTQPAVSKRIAALEAELGTRLFDRIGRQIHLTEAGRALHDRAHQLLRQLEDIRRSIANLAGEITGPLAFATSHHIGLHRLPKALKQFHNEFPHVQLDIQFMDSEKGCAAVARGDLELAIVTLPPTTRAPLRSEVLWEDPLDFVVSPEHPLAKTNKSSPSSLLAYPAILPGPGTFTRELILNALGSLRNQIRIGMATNYLEVLKMLASIGLGWSALPRTMIDDSLHVLQIRKMTMYRRLGIVTHASHTLSNAAETLIRVVRESME